MKRIVLHRLLVMIPILLMVQTIAFGLVHLVPGDPAVTVAGETATPEQLERVRERLGLTDSLPIQYVRYIGDTVRLDLGRSIVTDTTVTRRIGETLSKTVSIGLVAAVFAVTIAVPAGVLAARRRQRLADRVVTATSALALAVPPFVIALVLVVPLAVKRRWFPASGYVSFGENPLQWFRHLVLPALAVSAVMAAELARQVRSSVLEVSEQDQVRAARARGLSERHILLKHVFRNAAVPVLSVFGLQVGRLLGAAVVVEQIFVIAGFGSLAYGAVISHDFPVVRGIVLVGAIIVLLANLLVDIANSWVNPKLRIE